MDLGLAGLGFQGYSKKDVDIFLSFYEGRFSPTQKRLSFVWNSFGKSTRNLKKWYSICDNNSITKVYISNEVDRRKERTDSNNLLYLLDVNGYNKRLSDGHRATIRQVKKRVREIVKTHKRLGRGELQLILGLEDNFTELASVKLAKYIREEIGNDIVLIRNPNVSAPSNSVGTCNFLEIHEITDVNEVSKEIGVTTDGYNISTTDCGKTLNRILTDTQLKGMIYKFRSTRYFELWHPSFNSLLGQELKLPIPAKRKSNINRDTINSLKKIQEFALDIKF